MLDSECRERIEMAESERRGVLMGGCRDRISLFVFQHFLFLHFLKEMGGIPESRLSDIPVSVRISKQMTLTLTSIKVTYRVCK